MWLSRLGYLEKNGKNGRNHFYRSTDKCRELASTLKAEIVLDNPADVQAARDACDSRPRRVRATGAWPDIAPARVGIFQENSYKVIAAIDFITDSDDERIRRDTNGYGGIETVNYRSLRDHVLQCCQQACTAVEIARSTRVPVHSVLALLARLVLEGEIKAITEHGKPGRLYATTSPDPKWHIINRTLLNHMVKLHAGEAIPKRAEDLLIAGSLAEMSQEGLRLTVEGCRAIKHLTTENRNASEIGAM